MYRDESNEVSDPDAFIHDAAAMEAVRVIVSAEKMVEPKG